MRKSVLLVASVALVLLFANLYGCEQESSPPERQEKKLRVEELGPSESPPSVSLQQAKTSGSDALKALPPEKPITVEDLERLNPSNNYDRAIIFGLMDCQLNKYSGAYGEQATKEYISKKLKEVDKAADELPPDAGSRQVVSVSIQAQMMNDGLTCSLKEITDMLTHPDYRGFY
jgi:hypothetical protein